MEFFISTQCGAKIRVDEDYYPFLSRFRWCLHGGKYASTSIVVGRKRKLVRMHQMVMGFPLKHIDHINGDGLDNRRYNLRLCTPSQNMANSSRGVSNAYYRGVHRLLKPRGRIMAQINHKGKKYFLGYHKTAEDAARAYDRAAIKFHGEFARLNFPEEK